MKVTTRRIFGKTSLKMCVADIATCQRTICGSSVICVTSNLGHPALSDSNKLVQTIIVHGLESPMFSPMFIHPESLRRILSFAHHWQFHIPKSTRLARLWVTSCCSVYSPFSKQCGFTLDSSLISFFLQSTVHTGQHVHHIRLRFGIIEEAYITEPQTVKSD